VDDTHAWCAVVSRHSVESVGRQWTLAPVLAWERPPVEVESRVVGLDRRRLPLAVATEESESVDIVRESWQRVVIVVAGDTDERNAGVSETSRCSLNYAVGLCVTSLAIHQVTRDDDRVHTAIRRSADDTIESHSWGMVGRVGFFGEAARSPTEVYVCRTE
jgi:hypothetical protein